MVKLLLTITIIGFALIVIIMFFSMLNRREGRRIMKMQEALIQEGNYKAASITTSDVQVLVNKQSNLKLLLMVVFSVLLLTVYFGFEYFNFARYIIEMVKYLKWW